MENGRPRTGEVFKCYKNVKRLYRKLCRYYINSYANDSYKVLGDLFIRDSTKFWKAFRKKRKLKHSSAVSVNELHGHFSNIMQDEHGTELNNVNISVAKEYSRVSNSNFNETILRRCQ